MFARLTIVQVNINKMDENIKLYKETVIPTGKSLKGYREAYYLTDRKTGKCISIGFWDSEEDAIASEQSGFYKEQLSKFKDLFTAPPVREGYEVSVKG